MESEPAFSLDCMRKNGRRERTGLIHQTLSQAREQAARVLRLGNGLYTSVDICNEYGIIDTIRNSAVPLNLSQLKLVDHDQTLDGHLVRH
jgi:hypothetical protein